MHKTPFLMIVAILVVSSCSGQSSESALETALAQALQETQDFGAVQTSVWETQGAASTSIPLSEVSLEEILLKNGDLPNDFVGGQIKSTVSKKPFADIPTPAKVIHQDFRAGEYASDGVMIFLYEENKDLEKAYSTLAEVLGKDNLYTSLFDVGERAIVSEATNQLFMVTSSSVLFIRCHALIYIQLFSPSVDAEVAATYAQRLDKRIESLVCP